MYASNKQIGLIHVLAGKAGMDEETRRDYLQRETGARSTKQLSVDEAARVIDDLQHKTGSGGAIAGLDNPIGRKLRALWIAAYDLGMLRNRSDRAMLAFLERQTGVSHVRFFNEPGQASAAIEGLKSWLARDGKVAWPAARDDVLRHKRAVLDAQWLKLIALGTVEPLHPDNPAIDLERYAIAVAWKQGFEYFGAAEYASVQNALGRKLRKAMAKERAQP